MYVRVEWPESQEWMGEEFEGEVEYADDMAVFVPEELYYAYDADDWFCEIDFNMMERISGKRRDDYSDEDGYQDFVDAVEIWWNAQSNAKKVEIYYQNN